MFDFFFWGGGRSGRRDRRENLACVFPLLSNSGVFLLSVHRSSAGYTVDTGLLLAMETRAITQRRS